MPYTGSHLVYTEVWIYHAAYQWNVTLRTTVFLSPIAQFPGPKLAAFTTSYQAYFDLVQGGLFFKHLEKLHEKYGKNSRKIDPTSLFLLTILSIAGPVVRINPHELHINDPAFIDELYAGNNKKRDKFKWQGRAVLREYSVHAEARSTTDQCSSGLTGSH